MIFTFSIERVGANSIDVRPASNEAADLLRSGEGRTALKAALADIWAEVRGRKVCDDLHSSQVPIQGALYMQDVRRIVAEQISRHLDGARVVCVAR